MATLEIGTGTVVSGDFTTIDWSSNSYFIQTEMDPAGGTNYTITGVSPLLSVPYALHTITAETVTGNITEDQISDLKTYIETETDPSVPNGTQTGDMQYWNGDAWVVIAATLNEGATLQMISGLPTWTGGTVPATVPAQILTPSAPAGNGEATITFTEPNDSGSAITSYKVTSNPEGLRATGTASPITITGLTNGTSYTFTVTATNAVGTSTASTASNPVTPAVPLPDVGDPYQGGIIAYILKEGDPGYDADVQHGLIAAMTDQTSDIVSWAISENYIFPVGGTGTAIGTGLANTDLIITQNGADSTYAAGLARAYDGGGYSDWYLPSKDELFKLYENQNLIGEFNSAESYWSSSEPSAESAWQIYFGNGFLAIVRKTNENNERAVRSF